MPVYCRRYKLASSVNLYRFTYLRRFPQRRNFRKLLVGEASPIPFERHLRCQLRIHSEYDYFIDHDGNVFGDMIEFDGTHGLSAYNKTDQEKYEGSDSTFISPKYVQTIESKPVSEWIIAVGKHEGFIPSEQWIEVQELLDAIAEKYNRPHRKTNALLAGLAHVRSQVPGNISSYRAEQSQSDTHSLSDIGLP